MTQQKPFVLGTREEYAHAEALRAAEAVDEENSQAAYQERYDEAYAEYIIVEQFHIASSQKIITDEEIAAMYSDLFNFNLDSLSPKALEVIAAHRPELGRIIAQAIAEA